MFKRLTEREKGLVRLFVADRDGRQCQEKKCGKLPENMDPPVQWHALDHKNENAYDHDPDNFQFLCTSHNTAKQNRHRARLRGDSDGAASAARNGGPHDRTPGDPLISLSPPTPNERRHARREAIGYQDGTPEMRANEFYWSAFREWVWATLPKHGGYLSKPDAKNAGAMATGASTKTIETYLDKLCSFEGPFEWTKNEAGILGIQARMYEQALLPADRRIGGVGTGAEAQID